MRRRIDIEYDEEYYSDITEDLARYYRIGGYALYDEDVWQRYQDAVTALATATRALHEACVYENADDVEQEIRDEYAEAHQVYCNAADDDDESEKIFEVTCEALRARAVAHANTRVKP